VNGDSAFLFVKKGGGEMKTLALMLVVMFGLLSFAWAEPPVRRVAVVNEYLNVDIQNQPVQVEVINQPDPMNVSIDESQMPLEVSIMDQSQPLQVVSLNQAEPIQYECFVFHVKRFGEGTDTIQETIDQKTLEGYELCFFNAYSVELESHYVEVMRKPVVEE